MKRTIGLILIVTVLFSSIQTQEFAEAVAGSKGRSKDFERAIRDIVIDEIKNHSNHEDHDHDHDHADMFSHRHDDKSYLLNPLQMTDEEMAEGRAATDEIHRHQCVHDSLVVARNHDKFAHWKVENDPQGLLSHEEVVASYKNFDLASQYVNQPWENFRIKFVYAFTNIQQTHRQFLKLDLMEPVRHYFAEMLKVKRNPDGVKINNLGNCHSHQIGSVNEPNADLVVYVTAEQPTTPQGWIAWAGSCTMDPGSYRPNVGRINFNLDFVDPNVSANPAAFLEQASTLIHELMHVLGFSSSEFAYYQDANMNTIPEAQTIKVIDNQYTIVTPSVKSFAAQHYGCSSIQGVPMENQGGSGTAGSHWDRAECGNEIMTGSSTHEARFSKLSMHLLADSGWYEVNYAYADKWSWGENKGCGFVNDLCESSTQYEEFCYNSQGQSCDEYGRYVCYCSADSLSDGCSYWRPYSNGLVEGANKRCWRLRYTHPASVAGQTTTKGEQFQCGSNKASIKMRLSDNGPWYTCNTPGEEVTVAPEGAYYKYKLLCPSNFEKYCDGLGDTMCDQILRKEYGVPNGPIPAPTPFPEPTPEPTPGPNPEPEPPVTPTPNPPTPEPEVEPPVTPAPQPTAPGLTCSPSQFKCADNSKCICGGWYCDGSRDNGNANWPADCPDKSDENVEECCAAGRYNAADCPQPEPSPQNPNPCPTTADGIEQWQCANGVCIPKSYRCDGTNQYWGPDCTDESDEIVAECCAEFGKYPWWKNTNCPGASTGCEGVSSI